MSAKFLIKSVKPCLWLIVAFLAAGSAGCRFTRKAAKSREVLPAADSTAAAAQTPAAPNGLIGPLPDEELTGSNGAVAGNAAKQALIATLTPLYNRAFSYNTFSGKAKAHYEGKDKSEDFNAVIRLEKDKKIWISIRALGLVEVANGLITPDTIKFINRLQHEAYVLPFSEAGKLLPVNVDFATLQRLLIGDILTQNGQPTDASDFGGGYAMSVAAGSLQQQLTWNKTDSTLRQQQAANGDSLALLLQYGDYKMENGRNFPHGRVMRITAKDEQVFLSLDFTSASFDEPLEFNFSIPSKYKLKNPGE